MSLSSDLLSQLVKVTKPTKRQSAEATVYGTAVEQDGDMYVQLDGSDVVTPVSSTVKLKSGERVMVTIKDHSAVVTGNLTTKSARSDDVEDIVDEITEVEILVASKVSTDELDAVNGRIDNLVSDNVTIKGSLSAAEADIENLQADNVVIKDKLTANEASIENLEATKLSADVADLKYASIDDLEAVNAVIYNLDATYATIEALNVVQASIEDLDVGKLSAEQADLRYASIDFANIGEAAIKNLFSKSGMIDDLTMSEGRVTGTLVGVTIIGDCIRGGTIVAEKLVVKGEDGLYYRLNVDGESVESEQTDYNSLNGSVITAKSVTAEKISVDDLVAFGATIGGFRITEDSLYSGVKSAIDNTTQGVYLDSEGQMNIGDGDNYLRYYKDQDDVYRLILAADSILFGTGGKSIESAFGDVDQSIADSADSVRDEVSQVNGNFQSFVNDFRKYIRFLGESALVIGSGDSAITLEIDNETGIVFKKNGVQFGFWDGVDFHTGNIVVNVNERAQLGNFAFVPRSDGSLSFLKVGGE